MDVAAPPITLTDRDFESNLEALFNEVRRRAPATWTSRYEGDLGTALLQVTAYDATMLTFIQDQQFREVFLDTLKHWESIRHHARASGYRIRRNAAAVLDAYVEASVAPSAPAYLLIPRGSKLTSNDGLVWETLEDAKILPGMVTPSRPIIGFGDIRARSQDLNGLEVEVEALVKIVKGDAHAVLVDNNGARIPSQYNFTQLAGSGQILKLTSAKVGNNFGPAPDPSRREFAVISVGRLEFDKYPNGVLYLDRPWDGVEDFIGKWELESRSILLSQGESQEDREIAPVGEDKRIGFTVTTGFYPVIGGSSEPLITAGSLGGQDTLDSGIIVSVNGVTWRETASLRFETAKDRVFEIDFDFLDRAIIKFGDGINGAIVPASAEIAVIYRTGGGSAGNIPNGSLSTSATGQLVPAQGGSSGTVFISNPYTSGAGGRNRETIQEAKANIHRFLRANDRAVTQEDYDYLASNFVDPLAGRVALAKAALKKNAVPREQNIIWVHTWAEGTGGQLIAPSMPIKRALHAYLSLRKMITDEVIVVDGESLRVPIYAYVRYDRAVEEWQMREQLRSGFSTVIAALRPGNELLLSRLYEAVEAVPSIEMALLRTPMTNTAAGGQVRLITNSLLEPTTKTRLLAPCYRGDLSAVLESVVGFAAGGVCTFVQPGQLPTVAEIETVVDNVVTLRRQAPLVGDYVPENAAGVGCEIYNSDYIVHGWQYEKPADVFITYDTASGNIDRISAAIAYKIRDFFAHTVKPELPVLRSQLEYLVSSTNGVTQFTIRLGSFDGTSETLSCVLREKLVCGTLNINGTAF